MPAELSADCSLCLCYSHTRLPCGVMPVLLSTIARREREQGVESEASLIMSRASGGSSEEGERRCIIRVSAVSETVRGSKGKRGTLIAGACALTAVACLVPPACLRFCAV